MRSAKSNRHSLTALAVVLSLVLIQSVNISHAKVNQPLQPANAQDRTINVNEKLDFRALGIDNEARQIVSLVDAQVKFFKRGAELKGIASPRDPGSFFDEADARKSDLVTIKRQLESLINKLKQKNQWNETFDAQFLTSLKNNGDRSALTQAGGARKVFQAALDDVGLVREDIDAEVRQVKSKQTGALRNRRDRVFAAHASPPYGKAGCNLLYGAYLAAITVGPFNTVACAIAKRYNDKGCGQIGAGDCN